VSLVLGFILAESSPSSFVFVPVLIIVVIDEIVEVSMSIGGDGRPGMIAAELVLLGSFLPWWIWSGCFGLLVEDESPPDGDFAAVAARHASVDAHPRHEHGVVDELFSTVRKLGKPRGMVVTLGLSSGVR
jgi:ABC-type nickel/cobalt efflux system permease component RcnA